jgi:hypothetical protein
MDLSKFEQISRLRQVLGYALTGQCMIRSLNVAKRSLFSIVHQPKAVGRRAHMEKFSKHLATTLEDVRQLRKGGHEVEVDISVYITGDPELTTGDEEEPTRKSHARTKVQELPLVDIIISINQKVRGSMVTSQSTSSSISN